MPLYTAQAVLKDTWADDQSFIFTFVFTGQQKPKTLSYYIVKTRRHVVMGTNKLHRMALILHHFFLGSLIVFIFCTVPLGK